MLKSQQDDLFTGSWPTPASLSPPVGWCPHPGGVDAASTTWLASPTPKTCWFFQPFPMEGANQHYPHNRCSMQLCAPGRDVQPVQAAPCTRQRHAPGMCSSVHQAGLCTGLQRAYVLPQNSSHQDHRPWSESKTAGAAPVCLSTTLRRGPGHWLGKLPQRSRDKPFSLRFSQWAGIFSSGLVAACPHRL